MDICDKYMQFMHGNSCFEAGVTSAVHQIGHNTYITLLDPWPKNYQIKVAGSLRADTRSVYLIKHYFIVFSRGDRTPGSRG